MVAVEDGWGAVGVRSAEEEVDELEFFELELEVRAALLQFCAFGPGPLDGGEEVVVVSELVQDVVHV